MLSHVWQYRCAAPGRIGPGPGQVHKSQTNGMWGATYSPYVRPAAYEVARPLPLRRVTHDILKWVLVWGTIWEAPASLDSVISKSCLVFPHLN